MTSPPKQYYKDLETGVEMEFIFTPDWGWGVRYINLSIEELFSLTINTPFPTLTAEQQKIVDNNYEKLYKALEEEE